MNLSAGGYIFFISVTLVIDVSMGNSIVFLMDNTSAQKQKFFNSNLQQRVNNTGNSEPITLLYAALAMDVIAFDFKCFPNGQYPKEKLCQRDVSLALSPKMIRDFYLLIFKTCRA